MRRLTCVSDQLSGRTEGSLKKSSLIQSLYIYKYQRILAIEVDLKIATENYLVAVMSIVTKMGSVAIGLHYFEISD